MNIAPNATAYTDRWCFAMSITICNNRDASGIRLLKAAYEKMLSRAITVKTIAPE